MSEYEDRFPKGDGPPAVVNYSGEKIFNDTKGEKCLVRLDPGAMRAAWELLEAEAKRRYPTHQMASTGALLRAAEAFREAYWIVNEKPVEPQKKPTGRVVPTKRAQKDAVPPAAKKRRVKRPVPVVEVQREVPARRVRRIRPQ